MYETRSVTEVARLFAEYINQVVYRGERFVLMRGNKPVAELGPLPMGKRRAELPGRFTTGVRRCANWIWLRSSDRVGYEGLIV